MGPSAGFHAPGPSIWLRACGAPFRAAGRALIAYHALIRSPAQDQSARSWSQRLRWPRVCRAAGGRTFGIMSHRGQLSPTVPSSLCHTAGPAAAGHVTDARPAAANHHTRPAGKPPPAVTRSSRTSWAERDVTGQRLGNDVGLLAAEYATRDREGSAACQATDQDRRDTPWVSGVHGSSAGPSITRMPSWSAISPSTSCTATVSASGMISLSVCPPATRSVTSTNSWV
jgi:hypothetical protein